MNVDKLFNRIAKWPTPAKASLLILVLIGFLFLLGTVFAPCAKAASVNLTWTAPTMNSNGTPLTDLAGFRIYYGNAPGIYGPSIDVGNVTAVAVDVGPVESVTLFFAATAYDDKGNESIYSNEVSVPFPAVPPAPPESLRVGP